MRVGFLLHDLGPSGGVSVVLAHARGLQRAGADVDLVLTGTAPGREAPEGLRVRSLADAVEESYDWAIATWWETAAPMFELRARRRMAFLQSFEERFYTEDEPLERLAAGAVLQLPVNYVVIAGWMRRLLESVRPDARCELVPNGVDKDVFRPREGGRREGPLRVLIEGQHTLWFKGVQQALEAVRAMREPAHVTLVALDPDDVGGLEADRVVGGLAPDEMAELYASSDVLLKLSRVEGLPLPVLEALHTGLPCVITPFGAHDELVEHGRNGLVVGFDDLPGTARALDLLARDGELLERLSRGARESTADWPDTHRASDTFVEALERLDGSPEPEAPPALAGLLAAIRMTQEMQRGKAGVRLQRELAAAQDLVHELSASRDECAELLRRAHEERDEARSTLAYRATAKARSLLRPRAR